MSNKVKIAGAAIPTLLAVFYISIWLWYGTCGSGTEVQGCIQPSMAIGFGVATIAAGLSFLIFYANRLKNNQPIFINRRRPEKILVGISLLTLAVLLIVWLSDQF